MIHMFKSKKSNTLALSAILLAIVCSNSQPIFTKLLFKQGWTPLSVYFLIIIIVTIFLSVHEFLELEEIGRWGMTKRDIKGLILTTLSGGIISPILFFTAISYLQASEVVLLSSLTPVFTVIFAVLLLGERFSESTIIGSVFLIVGMVVLIWPDIQNIQANIGAILLVGSTTTSALTTVMHKKYIKNRHLDSIVLVRVYITLIILACWMWITEPESFKLFVSPQNMWYILGLPIIGWLLPFFLYFRALREVKAMEAGLLAGTGPIIGVLMAAAFLKETITTTQIISIGFIFFGILNINVPLTRWRIVPSRLMEIGPLRK